MSEGMERSRKTGIAVVGALLGGTLAGVTLLGQGALARDLEPGAEKALEKAGISDVDVSFYGREATLRGDGKTAAERDAAIDAVESVRGVRWAKFATNSDGSTGSDKASNSSQSAKPSGGTDSDGKASSDDFKITLGKKNGEVDVSGGIDTDANAKALLSEGSRIFGAPTVDGLNVDSNLKMPSWWGELSKTMVKFPKIRGGSLDINADGIALKGGVADAADLDTLKAALKDVSFKVDNSVTIDPAVAIDFDAAGGATVTGSVPSRADADAIVAEAKRIYGEPINDQLKIVAESDGSAWFTGFSAALKSIPAIHGGKLAATADGLDLSGKVASDADLAAITSAVEGLGLTVNNTVTVDAGSTPSASPSTAAPSPSASPSATQTTPAPSPSPSVAAGPSAEAIAKINGTVVNFADGIYGLDAAGKAKLDAIIPTLRSSTISLTINGYVSVPHVGDAPRDSTRRAQAAADYLVAAGIDASRLTVVGKGAVDPVAPNTTAQGRYANQRATLTVKGN